MIIAIHPLDDKDDMQIVPGLIRDVGGSVPEKSLTVIGEDGTKLTGECIRYRPWGEETYFEWNFGKADPGRYTLNIPWVYMKADMPGFRIAINPLENSWENKKYPITGGSIWIKDCVPVYGKAEGMEAGLWDSPSPTMRNWRLYLGCDSVHSLCPVTGFYGLSCEMECYPPDAGEESTDVHYFKREYYMTMISKDTESGILEYVLGINLELANPENMNLFFNESGAVSLLWKQSFEIPFTIGENN